MIRYKEGITLGLRPEIERVLVPIDIIMHEHGCDLTITCGRDGHGNDDPHSHGFAVDLRTHDLALGDRSNVRDEIAEMAGPEYTVILENPGGASEHLHFQIKREKWREIVANETNVSP